MSLAPLATPSGPLDTAYPARWWHKLDDGRLQCDLCPRDCKLHDGQRGACFVRQRIGDQMVLATYGRSSGFCIDPIEKKPLNHFHPGSSVLSFGTAGCNLACKFCQNWDISKSRDMDRLMDAASPAEIARVASEHGCRSVAFALAHEAGAALALVQLAVARAEVALQPAVVEFVPPARGVGGAKRAGGGGEGGEAHALSLNLATV